MKEKTGNLWKSLQSALDFADDPLSRRKKLLWFWGIYTLLFGIIFMLGFWIFFQRGLSFIHRYDALQQHIVAQQYFGQYWRALLRNYFTGDFFSALSALPMFDFGIGMGNDIIQPLTTLGIGDVFSLGSVFVPVRHTETYYNALIILRPYLAGLTFSAFCFYAKQKNWAILTGSLVYAFSGYALFANPRHPFFSIALIYAPLVFLGLDMILRKKKPFLFIISIFLLALTGFYFLYMISVFMFVYAFIRIYHLYGKKFWRKIFPLSLKAISSYLLGLMMASVLFLPMILGFFLGPDRGVTLPEHLWFISLDHIISKFINITAMFATWDYLGLAAVVLPVLIMFFISKTEKPFKRCFLLFFGFALILYIFPAGSLFMNGFGYATGRWTFLFSLILSFLTVYMLPRILPFNQVSSVSSVSSLDSRAKPSIKYMLSNLKKETVFLIVSLCVYGYFTVFNDTFRSWGSLIAFCMLLPTVIIIFACNTVKLKPTVFRIALILVVAVNLILNSYYMNHEDTGKYINDFEPHGIVKTTYNSLPSLSKKVRENDQSFYRVDVPYNWFPNSSSMLNYNGLTSYWSLMNGVIPQGFVENELPLRFLFCIRGGFDGRAALNALASVKYYSTRKHDTPAYFGYTLYDETNHKTKTDKKQKQKIYLNEYSLPLGYTYDKHIPGEEYLELSALDKQEAMLQAVVLNNAEEEKIYPGAVNIEDLQFTSREIPYILQSNGLTDLTWDDNVLNIEKDNTAVTLTFAGEADSETYVRLSGFFSETMLEAEVSLKTEILYKSRTVPLAKHPYFYDEYDYLFNLGYSEEPQTAVTITFKNKGTYSLEDIKIYCYPMKNYPAQVNALKEEPLENIEIKPNRVTGDAFLSSDKIMVLSIPYSKGWSAKVNGENADLLQANTMFTALPLKAGKNTIELTYLTPGIVPGLLLSALGFAIFIGLVIYSKRVKNKKKHKLEAPVTD